MSILDAGIHVGEESVTYGTKASSFTRSYEGKADSFARNQEYLDSVGFRAGMETLRTDRRRAVNNGGAGSLEVDWLDRSMGLLLKACFDNVSGPTQQSGTAYASTFTTGTDCTLTPLTVQYVRPTVAACGREIFTHLGCTVTGWKIAGSVGSLLSLSADFDWQDVTTAESEGTNNYAAAGAQAFAWTECTITIPGATPSTIEPTGFEVSANLGLKTDRRYLRGSALKKQPWRASVPEYSGTLTGVDFDSTAFYDLFEDGTEVGLNIVYQGELITGAYYFEVEIDLPSVKFEGSSPVMSLNDVTKLDMPFRVLDDGTNPAITLTVTSTDTTL